MRQIYVQEPHQLVIKNVEPSEPKPDEVGIRIQACGLCATDIHSYRGESIMNRGYPFHIGHEIAGTVHAIGCDVGDVDIGDKVIVDSLIPCGRCEFCHEGKFNHCMNMNSVGLRGPGGFSDYTTVPAINIYKFQNIDFESAAFAEPLACVVYGNQRSEVGPGDRVLIMGAGPIGLLHLQMALLSGSSSVVVTDLVQEKLDLSKKLGADRTILASEEGAFEKIQKIGGEGFDLVIDCTGAPKVVEKSLHLVRKTGRLLIFGVCPQGEEISINPFLVYRRDIKIIGAFAFNNTFRTAIGLMESKRILIEPLIGEVLSSTDLEHAIQLQTEGKVKGKIIIRPAD